MCIRDRDSAQRGPPELCFEPFLVNSIHHSLDVGITTRKLLRIQLPVTVVVLPPVVERDPRESHPFDCRKRVVNLLRFEVPAVSPGTPDCSEGLLGCRSHVESQLRHVSAVAQERLKVVPVVYCNEAAKSVEVFTRSQ